MKVVDVAVLVLTVLGTLIALVMLHRAIRRDPAKEASMLARAFMDAEQTPWDLGALVRAQLLYHTSARYYPDPIGAIIGFIFMWVVGVTAILAFGSADAITSIVAVGGFTIMVGLATWVVTRSEEARTRRRVAEVLFALARAEQQAFVDRHQEVETSTSSQRRAQERVRRIQHYLEQNPKMRVAMFATLLAALVLALVWGLVDLGLL